MYGCNIPKMCSSKKKFAKLRHAAGAVCVRELRDGMQIHNFSDYIVSEIHNFSDYRVSAPNFHRLSLEKEMS